MNRFLRLTLSGLILFNLAHSSSTISLRSSYSLIAAPDFSTEALALSAKAFLHDIIAMPGARRLQGNTEVMHQRIVVTAIYDVPLMTAAWLSMKHFTRLVIPSWRWMPLVFGLFLTMQFLAMKRSQRGPSSVTAKRWTRSAWASIAIIGVLTLGIPEWTFRMGYGGHYIDYHDVWGWTAALFGIAVVNQLLFLMHSVHYWKQWDVPALQSVLGALQFCGMVLTAVGVYAGISHYLINSDLFYNIRCFKSESIGGVLLLGIWLVSRSWANRLIARQA